MNKQELIEKLESAIEYPIINDYQRVEEIALNYAIDIAKRLDEPEKPVVPQFVAEFIASEQRSCSTLSEAIDNMDMGDDGGVTSWFYDNSEIFAKAWLFGYEVEKEKLYTVEIPNPNSKGTNKIYLCKDDTTGKVYLCKVNFNPSKNRNLRLTESEIKKDFGWAWQFAEEVEE